MTWARERLAEEERGGEEGAGEGAFLCLAGEQTGGAGRHGRFWASPPGGLYATLVLPPEEGGPVRAAEHGFLMSLAIAEGAESLLGGGADSDAEGRRGGSAGGADADAAAGVCLSCKWPNDVLYEGRKLAGLLLESRLQAGRSGALLIGFGVNLKEAPKLSGTDMGMDAGAGASTDAGAGVAAVSLAELGAVSLSVEDALAAILRAFAKWQAIRREGGFAPVREAWLARAAHTPGAAMTLRLAAGGAVAGVYRGLDESGRLLLEEGGGTTAFASGEVVGARFRVAGTGDRDGRPEGCEKAERAVLS